MAPLFKQQLIAIGGDVVAKYGTLVRRTGMQTRGGEIPYTFTRTGNGLYVASDAPAGGTWKGLTASANNVRIEQAVDPVTGLIQNYLLLEPAGTNIVENSDYEADAVGSGSAGGATLVRDNAQAFNGAWSLKITTTNSQSGAFLTKRDGTRFAATAATVYTASFWVFAPAASVGKTFNILIEWWTAATGGSNIANSTSGTLTLVAGWQRFTFTATAPGTTVAAVVDFYAQAGQGVFTYWQDVPQFEASPFPTSAIPTLTAAVTRNIENFSVPWFSPPPSWLYARWLERGAFLDPSATSRQVASVGNGVGPRLILFKEGTTQLPRGLFTDNVLFTRSTPANTPTYGQVVEGLVLLYPDGSVQTLESINNGAVSDGGRSAALGAPMPTTVGGNILTVGPGGAGGDGWIAVSRVLAGIGTVTSLADVRNAL